MLIKENSPVAHVLGITNNSFSSLIKVICKAVGYDSDDLVLTSRFHDVGKHFVPMNILVKAGPLSTMEFDVVKNHTLLGYLLLDEPTVFQSQLNELVESFSLPMEVLESKTLRDKAASIALHHHERWNGSGYPYGLIGEDIPFESQLVALADVIDALFTERPYKKSWTPREVFNYIDENSGTLFNPEIVELLKVHFNRIANIYSNREEEQLDYDGGKYHFQVA